MHVCYRSLENAFISTCAQQLSSYHKTAFYGIFLKESFGVWSTLHFRGFVLFPVHTSHTPTRKQRRTCSASIAFTPVETFWLLVLFLRPIVCICFYKVFHEHWSPLFLNAKLDLPRQKRIFKGQNLVSV